MLSVSKCKNADRYKAIRKPSCGCFVCETKWRIAELERKYVSLEESIGLAKDRSRSSSTASNAALYVANLRLR